MKSRLLASKHVSGLFLALDKLPTRIVFATFDIRLKETSVELFQRNEMHHDSHTSYPNSIRMGGI